MGRLFNTESIDEIIDGVADRLSGNCAVLGQPRGVRSRDHANIQVGDLFLTPSHGRMHGVILCTYDKRCRPGEEFWTIG